ncbi:MAG: thymidine kinase [Deltaproteobacteria bacterium]|nr:thymidine kinase [Deltaproteobacteria bacterium]
MAKLYFRYGTVGSAKTLNLLAVAHNYAQQNKRCYIIKPALDDRFGRETVASRAGLEQPADLVLETDAPLNLGDLAGVDCVVVDEAQFLSPAQIDELRGVTTNLNVPVICYGLRTDFRVGLFPGSRRLLELADAIEEIKTTCHYCNRKAVFNLKLADGKPTLAGPTIDLGTEEKYLPTCSHCFHDKLREAGWDVASSERIATDAQ